MIVTDSRPKFSIVKFRITSDKIDSTFLITYNAILISDNRCIKVKIFDQKLLPNPENTMLN